MRVGEVRSPRICRQGGLTEIGEQIVGCLIARLKSIKKVERRDVDEKQRTEDNSNIFRASCFVFSQIANGMEWIVLS